MIITDVHICAGLSPAFHESAPGCTLCARIIPEIPYRQAVPDIPLCVLTLASRWHSSLNLPRRLRQVVQVALAAGGVRWQGRLPFWRGGGPRACKRFSGAAAGIHLAPIPCQGGHARQMRRPVQCEEGCSQAHVNIAPNISSAFIYAAHTHSPPPFLPAYSPSPTPSLPSRTDSNALLL